VLGVEPHRAGTDHFDEAHDAARLQLRRIGLANAQPRERLVGQHAEPSAAFRHEQARQPLAIVADSGGVIGRDEMGRIDRVLRGRRLRGYAGKEGDGRESGAEHMARTKHGSLRLMGGSARRPILAERLKLPKFTINQRGRCVCRVAILAVTWRASSAGGPAAKPVQITTCVRTSVTTSASSGAP
jgi:hypothetical protein